jgi:hypothetical protein
MSAVKFNPMKGSTLRRLLSTLQGGDGYHKSVAGLPGVLTADGKRVKLLSQLSPLQSDPLKGNYLRSPCRAGTDIAQMWSDRSKNDMCSCFSFPEQGGGLASFNPLKGGYLRRLLLPNCRAGTVITEVWQDGQVFKDLGARQLAVVEQRAQIEARRKQLKKKGQGNAHDNNGQIMGMCLLSQSVELAQKLFVYHVRVFRFAQTAAVQKHLERRGPRETLERPFCVRMSLALQFKAMTSKPSIKATCNDSACMF